jgi:iron complex outermembrane receptor protein
MSAGPKTFVALIVLAVGPAAARADEFEVAGRVLTREGRPIAGATVSVKGTGLSASVDGVGEWHLVVPAGEQTLEASRSGYLAAARSLTVESAQAGLDFVLDPLFRRSEDVVVQAIRAETVNPVTKTDVDRAEIMKWDRGQEMPTFLQTVPSATQYSDTGLGTGYNYLFLRGISMTRLNLTLDGVPLNEPEDSALYFVDFGNFTASLDSIQVQRGVGTSSVGTASYAGSINFASLDIGEKPSLAGRFAAGSYGTNRASLGAESGLLGPGLRLYGRGSWQESDGFRERSGVRQKSLFYGVSRQDDHSFFKLFGFVGRERTQLAFLAADEDTLAKDLRANPLAPEERDEFGQQFVQAQYTRFLGSFTSLAGQVYWNSASGWYRLWADETHQSLYQYNLDWHFGGGLVTLRHVKGPVDFTAGVHANGFTSTHARDVVDVGPQYRNRGFKNEQSAFAKLGYELGKVTLFGDAQLRHSSFRYEGDEPLGSVDWTFFNPKAGARFKLDDAYSLYASVGKATREPGRSDMLAGEDNATLPYDLHAVKPERVLDFEAGLERHGRKLALQLSAFAMEFHDEIAQTGELSEIGLPLRRNVDRSYRRGLELDLRYRPVPQLDLRLSASAIKSRIRTWTQFYDVYDQAGTYLESVSRELHDVPPLLTPSFLANPSVEYAPTKWLGLAAAGRYSSTSYLDNTGNEHFQTPHFFGLDASATLSLGRWIKKGDPQLRVYVGNVFDNHHIWPSGYSYLTFTRDPSGVDVPGGIAYFYPQATRTVLVSLDLKL